jgi:hypothetical protein
MQFKQVTANYLPQNFYQQNQLAQTGFKNMVQFAKSECPSPKTRIGDDGLKGNHTQARFFSRKNSSSNQNILIQSQNNNLSKPAPPNPAILNSHVINPQNIRQSLNGLSPSQQT